ncbi:STRUBBELIG-receptor family 3 [Prunus dulcis]|uniref:STRUBBELIG-receptor family 3 n=1 Tax=Prunus dulcis TaxID=3755 RepID=A0A4Y1R9M9_PRUDU|nr:STRUBBELIG-receptor family 3 [Prunus dulcis]
MVAAINGLYVALGYPPLQGWLLVGGDPCGDHWQGVECVFSNVTGLKLNGAKLGGQLGDSLGLFGDLSNNHIGGSIPSPLPPTVRNVSLDNNHLSGEMPDAFQLLTGLNRLNLQNNRLVGTLNVLQDLPLQDLNIENNLFSGPIPAKLLSIPNFRKDGNPFNTTIIPSPPAPAPSFLARAPSSYEQPWKQANGPSSPVTLNSATPRKFLTAKTVTGIAVGGILVLIVFILCLLVRCFKGRREKKKAKQHELNTYKIPRESTKHSESSLPEGVPMEKVPKEAVMKPLDGYGADSNRMVVIPKPQKENKIDVQSIAESSMHKKDHVVDMTDMDAEFLPPPPPPFSLLRYTNSFSEENFIGAGMLGSVYRAKLPDQKVLAVKKLDNTACRQHSDEEFMDLVYNICTTRHANIVELVGYCAEHGQRLLVYEYCRNGTLHDALHTDDEIHQKLSWSVRIRIALGAARALEYLHEVCQPPVVHHNFKSANLLLDEKLEVHVSDCGLAPLIMSPSMSGHLLTAYGSAAPEFDSGSYTHQSDVYSFGVVMLELLTGRKSYDRSRPRGEQYLVRWAVPKLHDIDALSRMVDPSLNGAFTMNGSQSFDHQFLKLSRNSYKWFSQSLHLSGNEHNEEQILTGKHVFPNRDGEVAEVASWGSDRDFPEECFQGKATSFNII